MRLVALLAVAAAALLGGCGTNLSEDEFVARADGICAGSPLLTKTVLEDLKQVVPPRGLASPYGKFLDEAKKKEWPEAADAAAEAGIEKCARLAEAASP